METLSIFLQNHIFMFILFFLLPSFLFYLFFVFAWQLRCFFFLSWSYFSQCCLLFLFHILGLATFNFNVGLLHFLCEGVWCLSSIDLNLYTIDSFYFHCLHTNLEKLCYRNFLICFVFVVGYDVNNCVSYV